MNTHPHATLGKMLGTFQLWGIAVGLRQRAPSLERPFRAPGYPFVPAFALGAAVVCLLTMLWFNRVLGAIFFALMAAGCVYFRATGARRAGVAASAPAWPRPDASNGPHAQASSRPPA